MLIRRLAVFASMVVSLAGLPIAAANAQSCAFPLEWPFCIAGAAVNTAAAIATAPFYAVGAAPYYYYGPRYYAPAYYYPPHHHHHNKPHHTQAHLYAP